MAVASSCFRIPHHQTQAGMHTKQGRNPIILMKKMLFCVVAFDEAYKQLKAECAASDRSRFNVQA